MQGISDACRGVGSVIFGSSFGNSLACFLKERVSVPIWSVSQIWYDLVMFSIYNPLSSWKHEVSPFPAICLADLFIDTFIQATVG